MSNRTNPNSKLKSARPTINIAGKDQPELEQGLLSLMIVENTTGLYRCEAAFGNWGTVGNRIDLLYFNRQLLDFGKIFQAKIGADIIFDGRIMGLEAQFPEGGAAQIIVLAEDRLQDLRMNRRSRTFSEMRDSEVFNQIASEHSLTPQINLATDLKHKVLVQVNQSDLAFLRECARSIDAEIWVEGKTLNVVSHTKRNAGKLQMTYGNQLREFSVLADLAGQRTGITVNGWDVASKAGLSHTANDSSLSGELNGDVSGGSILATALGARKESLAHNVPFNIQETQAHAESYFKMIARRFVIGRGVAETDSQLKVGCYVDLQELGPLFNGKYYLCEIRHIFDGKGIRTEFTAERPGIGKL
ncbi:hypothetical protein L0Z72_15315 [candidate division KSB1 bacterium]|nr:hypothetical protein [candidate division KSB1 bacterium]